MNFLKQCYAHQMHNKAKSESYHIHFKNLSPLVQQKSSLEAIRAAMKKTDKGDEYSDFWVKH